MAVRKILILGDPDLYKVSEPVKKDEMDFVKSIVKDLHSTLMDFRARYKVGRGIAAPQIGIFKRIVYIFIEKPWVLINPVLLDQSDEMMELWDDCFSFPGLLVRVNRHISCKVKYHDIEWNEKTMPLKDSLSELVQHECDHLEGILAVQRAIDGRSFAFASEKDKIDKKVR